MEPIFPDTLESSMFYRLAKKVKIFRISAAIALASYASVSCQIPSQSEYNEGGDNGSYDAAQSQSVAERIEEEYSDDLSESDIENLEDIIKDFHSGNLTYSIKVPVTLAWNPPESNTAKEYNIFVRERGSDDWLYLGTTAGTPVDGARSFEVGGHPMGIPFEGAYEFAVDARYHDGNTSDLHKSIDDTAEPEGWYAIIDHVTTADANGNGKVSTDELVDYILGDNYDEEDLMMSIDLWYAGGYDED